MKKIILISTTLLVSLAFFSRGFAGLKEGDVKSSPLFKQALNATIDNMENQGKLAENNDDGIATSKPHCIKPKKLPTETEEGETCESTCGGTTCYATCNAPTCFGGETCGSETCQSTCIGNCPWVQGDVDRENEPNCNWNGWNNRQVTLTTLGGWVINQTSFNVDGLYQMESDLGMLCVVATATSETGWHGRGDKTFYQYSSTAIIDITMDDFWQ